MKKIRNAALIVGVFVGVFSASSFLLVHALHGLGYLDKTGYFDPMTAWWN